MKKLIFPFFLFALLSSSVFSQELTLTEYLNWVLEEHPLAQKAKLNPKFRNAQYLQVKGLFDPVLESKFKDKFFSGTQYYSISETSLSYNTPYAIGLVGHFDVNTGSYVDPSDYTSGGGLLSLGVAVPLLKGLVIDERRMAKKRAEVLLEAGNLEQQLALNELLAQSVQLYSDWYYSVQKNNIIDSLVETSERRFVAVRERYLGGDRSAIDTLEGFAQYQNRMLQFQESKLDVIKKRIALVAFLENIDENRTAILNETISPSARFKNELAPFRSGSDLFLLLDSHPELALYANKGESLRIEEKWKTEKLKPKLNVEYHFLNKDFSEDLPSYFSTNNYRWGAEFSMPLLLREARGDLKVQRLKIEENNLNAEWKRKQLEQKTLAIDIAYSNTLQQQLLADNNSILYQRLLQAENTRLFNGESTLFIVNQRENTYFENAIKALDLDQKVQQVKIDQSALWVLNYLN
ncbi:MAG: TolC family protein [Flavobacteriales bacterium]|nr:TolC family protein [Flavobacteriales bacterium]